MKGYLYRSVTRHLTLTGTWFVLKPSSVLLKGLVKPYDWELPEMLSFDRISTSVMVLRVFRDLFRVRPVWDSVHTQECSKRQCFDLTLITAFSFRFTHTQYYLPWKALRRMMQSKPLVPSLPLGTDNLTALSVVEREARLTPSLALISLTWTFINFIVLILPVTYRWPLPPVLLK